MLREQKNEAATKPGALQQVVPEEEAPKRMLDPAAHLHQVSEDVPARVLVGLDVDEADGDEEIPGGTGLNSFNSEFINDFNKLDFLTPVIPNAA